MRQLLVSTLLALLPLSVQAQDATQTFLATQNYPLTTPLPVIASATPGNRLSLATGSSNAFSLRLGYASPGGNVTTGQAIRNLFYMNYLSGNLTSAIGAPMDTGQSGNAPFAAVARHYAVGDPNDLHIMLSNGMELRAICSANHTDCSAGHVYGAMVRVPFEFRPGMTLKVRYKSPAGRYAWCPIWMFSGSEISPGPGGNPWQGFNTIYSLVQEPVGSHSFEIDANDNYGRWNDNPSVAIGHQLDFGTPNIYGVQWITPPYQIYGANTAGYSFYPNAGPAFEALPLNWAQHFHNLVMSWDGAANTIYEFVDGKLVVASHMEYAQAPVYYDGFSNAWKVQAMHLIIGNQAIPQWLAGGSSTTENDGIPNGWSIIVQEISAWYGLVDAPESHKP